MKNDPKSGIVNVLKSLLLKERILLWQDPVEDRAAADLAEALEEEASAADHVAADLAEDILAEASDTDLADRTMADGITVLTTAEAVASVGL